MQRSQTIGEDHNIRELKSNKLDKKTGPSFDIATGELGGPPAGLGVYERQLWQHYQTNAPWLKTVDRELLETGVRAMSISRRIQKKLSKMLREDELDPRNIRGLNSTMKDSWMVAKYVIVELGLGVASRTHEDFIKGQTVDGYSKPPKSKFFSSRNGRKR